VAVAAAEVGLDVVTVVCAVLISRVRSETSGSSGLGQRELLETVFRAHS
jgi:hypothetical protein